MMGVKTIVTPLRIALFKLCPKNTKTLSLLRKKMLLSELKETNKSYLFLGIFQSGSCCLKLAKSKFVCTPRNYPGTFRILLWHDRTPPDR